MNFEHAMHNVKSGTDMRRKVWGNGVYVTMSGVSMVVVIPKGNLQCPDDPYHPTVTDKLANDWEAA